MKIKFQCATIKAEEEIKCHLIITFTTQDISYFTYFTIIQLRWLSYIQQFLIPFLKVFNLKSLANQAYD